MRSFIAISFRVELQKYRVGFKCSLLGGRGIVRRLSVFSE